MKSRKKSITHSSTVSWSPIVREMTVSLKILILPLDSIIWGSFHQVSVPEFQKSERSEASMVGNSLFDPNSFYALKDLDV